MKKIILLILIQFTISPLFSIDDNYFQQFIDSGYSDDFSNFKGYRVFADGQKLGSVMEFFDSYSLEGIKVKSLVSMTELKVVLEMDIVIFGDEGLYAIFEYGFEIDEEDKILNLLEIDAYGLESDSDEWEEEHAVTGDVDFIEGCLFAQDFKKEILNGEMLY